MSGKFNSNDRYVYYCGQESLEEMEQPSWSTKKSEMQYLGAISKNDRMILVPFQGKPFNITLCPNHIYAPTTDAEEAEVDQLTPTPRKDVLSVTGDWNAKVGSQEVHGLTGKFDLQVQNKAGQRLTEFCQENALVIPNTIFQ